MKKEKQHSVLIGGERCFGNAAYFIHMETPCRVRYLHNRLGSNPGPFGDSVLPLLQNSLQNLQVSVADC